VREGARKEARGEETRSDRGWRVGETRQESELFLRSAVGRGGIEQVGEERDKRGGGVGLFAAAAICWGFRGEA
jgi:hypothetical protein